MVTFQQHQNTLTNDSTPPGEEERNDDATLKDDGFIMSLNGKHNISPGGKGARHNSSKDVKKPTKVTPKLTSLAVAAGQSGTKASRGDNNVVTVEKDAVPPRSSTRTHPTTSTNSFIQSYHKIMATEQTVIDTVKASEPSHDPKLESIVKKLEFTNDESKHKMHSWAESSDDEDDKDDEDDEDFDTAADKEYQSNHFSSTRGL